MSQVRKNERYEAKLNWIKAVLEGQRLVKIADRNISVLITLAFVGQNSVRAEPNIYNNSTEMNKDVKRIQKRNTPYFLILYSEIFGNVTHI